MLEHIGITINEENDIQAFYKDLLGLKEVQKFDLYKDLSERLFGISNEVSVTHLSGDDLFLELFLTDRKPEQELSYQKGRIQGVPHYTDKKRIKR
ncbi:MAG: hypothetical protein JRC60_05750 [Deltaproteobacteria bacterium]|nr:hypothetical protein [Deltaproteobacteria bacterium]